MDYQAQVFPYRRSPDQDAAQPARHRVAVVGAGPVGLSLAIDLALHGVPVLLLDNDDRLSTGSRAICFAKRTLEIFDRLGCGERMVAKGVSWNLGKVFFRDQPVYQFNLQPEPGHQRPAFINLQQYYAEGFLAERAAGLPLLDLRWNNEVIAVEPGPDQVRLSIGTPEGVYQVDAEHVITCDGARSPLRQMLGLESKGRVFRDRFLIADVKMSADFPAERWFWFDPPFHRNQSALLHKQPDDVWRIDFQLGWDADPEVEKQPERIVARVKAMLAHTAMKDAPFELEWASVYTFSCERMAAFRHGRVFFAGDAAHRVSPFGARGANSGVQDADNLAWKLAAVLQGRAGEALLQSYGPEREAAADENIRHSTRATDFITPKSEVSRLFRDATLGLAREHGFARALVNSGRLSTPATLRDSPLNSADVDAFAGALVPGAPAADAPLLGADGAPAWLLRELAHGDFALIVWLDFQADSADRIRTLLDAACALAPTRPLVLVPRGQRAAGAWADVDGLATQRYDALPGTVYLLRPDQHVCARWRRPSAAAVQAAMRRALALS